MDPKMMNGGGMEGMMDDQTPGQSLQQGGKDQGEENIVHLSPDMLPQGAAAKLKAGDKLTFVVSGDPDEQGDIPGYFEPAGADESEPDNEDEWAQGMREAMSPAADQEKEA